jgi:large subunit ribosomal protein L25
MAELTLEAKKRSILGKAVRKLRSAGILPAVLYGRGIEPLPLEVSRAEFLKVFRKGGENAILKLDIKSGSESDVRNVLIHDVAIDALRGVPLHVDFYQVRLDEAVRVMVPLEFVGESPAVKNEGGILVRSLQEVEVESLPTKIPEKIEVDISKLVTFEDAIHVRDLVVSSDIKIITDKDATIATVQPPRSEEELKALEETPAPTPPEVITEAEAKKKAEAAEVPEEEVPEA